ncbi:MAG: hypothetical protein GY853_01595 [PVC group bacterium]|nr:hypothetical protein [PVC group bacterium]
MGDTQRVEKIQKVKLKLTDGSYAYDVYFLDYHCEYIGQYDCASEVEADRIIDSLVKITNSQIIEIDGIEKNH